MSSIEAYRQNLHDIKNNDYFESHNPKKLNDKSKTGGYIRPWE
ncbi:12206_t:CDS:2 [Dentiscutata erythropus]|uniref:12206_t:CDS:1 n=1 Tax=Dentiscutata erythropus TaxID=1348616 RepID=A0A9N8YTC1_9GLOM|nr:12206_t:CDS:2 [Dentiscutata erythropus]